MSKRTKTEINNLDFKLKNERRSRCRSKIQSHRDRQAYRDARDLRRAFGGAFGKAPDKTYNLCVRFTTGIERLEKSNQDD